MDDSFEKASELVRVAAFKDAHASTSCRRCKAKGVPLNKIFYCEPCNTTRLGTMAKSATLPGMEQPAKNENPEACNARLLRNKAVLEARGKVVTSPQTDAQKLIGENGRRATGNEHARLQFAENIRGQLEAAIKSLVGAADRSILNANARGKYEQQHAMCVDLATKYHAATGRSTTIEALRPDILKGGEIVVGETVTVGESFLDLA